jgi:hypothetical protein
MQGRTRTNYIFVSGFLSFACPLFLGLMAYDWIAGPDSLDNLSYYVGTALFLVILFAGGMFIGRRTWERSSLILEHTPGKEM